MATNKDATKVRVWGAATLYVGPLGTPAPAGLTAELDAAMVGLGYISDTGIAESTGIATADVVAYEGNVLRTIVTGGSYSLAALFEQTTGELLEQFYANATLDTSIVFDPLKQLDSYCWVLDMSDGPSHNRRIHIPNGQSRRNGDVTYSKKAESGFPLIVMGYPSADLVYDSVTGAEGTVQIWDDVIAGITGS